MIAVIYDPNNQHHSYRLVNGLRACGKEVKILHGSSKEKFDYVFVESSFPTELELDSYSNIFLYDVEDDPDQSDTGPAFHQLKDKALNYVKYNFTKEYYEGMRVIACPLADYMFRGHYLAKSAAHLIGKLPPLFDAFFIGGPSYYSLGYKPPKTTNHIVTEKLNTIPKNIWDPARKDQLVYHQRLEWIAKIKANPELSFAGGLWFTNDNSNISLEFQKKQFGEDIQNYQVGRVDENTLYNGLLQSRFGLCPTGFARSSFRLIELMALGKPILLTDDMRYQYLYNPIDYRIVDDGGDIDLLMLAFKDEMSGFEKHSLDNHKFFLELTPQKMWEDFINQ
jgi:glycosyltransferase involved in cell wall biosynthesis